MHREMDGEARTLDFLVVGVQKGGTTALWEHLRHHPGIALPESKEPPFHARPDVADPARRREFFAHHSATRRRACCWAPSRPTT